MQDLLYQAAPVTLLTMARDSALVIRRDSSETIEVTGTEALALRTISGCRTLRDHARSAWNSNVTSDPAALVSAMNKLLQLGLLRRVPTTSGQDPATLSSSVRRSVDAIAIITADRIEALSRALASVVEHCRLHGVRPRIVVVDGSRRDEHRAANQATVSRIASGGFDARYLGPTQAATLRRAVAGTRSVAPAAPILCPGEIGANRNLALLSTAGETLVMMDDDIVCEPWTPLPVDDGIELGGHADLRQWRFFGSRADACSGLSRSDSCLFEAHGTMLGVRLRDLLNAAGDRCHRQEACAHLLHADGGDCEVRVTLTGLAGDSARYCPSRWLFANGAVKRLLTSNQAALDSALTSREVQSIAQRIVITHDPACMSYCIGLSNRALMPPFMPLGRNEDGVFGAMLAYADRYALFAHLPVGVVHDSSRSAAYGAECAISATETRIGELLCAAIRGVSASTLARGTEDRLACLAGHFLDLAALTDDEFTLCVRETIAAGRCQELALLEQELFENDYPDFWRTAFEQYRRTFKASALKPEFFVPCEFRRGASPEDGLRRTKAFVRRFADFILRWPEIWEMCMRREWKYQC